MKFTEKFLQLQQSGETKKMMEQLGDKLDLIVNGRSQEVRYQMAYDIVYKLTKDHRQADLLSLLEQKLTAHLQKQYAELTPVSGAPTLLKILQDAGAIVGKMAEICLFLDVNYCQKELALPLRKRLEDCLLKSLYSETKALAITAESVFASREGSQSECVALLEFVGKLDEKEEFFERYLLGHYEPLIKKHYQAAAREKWKKNSLLEYLGWCKSELEKELQFGKAVLVRKKGQQGLESIQSTVYSVIVLAYKSRIYQADEQELFERLSLPILELFRLGRNKEVQGHVTWFMGRTEARLNALPVNQNAAFLTSFCTLYHRVAGLLKETQGKFEINYRAVFTFEEWINNEKFNVPLRLNILLDGHLRSGKQGEQLISSAVLVFKLVKEKNLFENLYRRLLLARLVQLYGGYKLDEQLRVVDMMEKECGDEWTKRIRSICQLFLKNRDIFKPQNGYSQALKPVIVEEGDWPFEQRQTKIALHSQLLDLTPPFQKKYLPANKNHRLLWSPLAGTATLTIKFKSGSRDILVGIQAANLLLCLQRAAKTLAAYLCESGYKLDEVQVAVQTLTSSKLVTSTPKGNDVVLELVQEFPIGGLLDLVTSSEKGEIEVKAMEQLKADRKLMVEAIIVKIMKSEKIAKRADLLAKTAPLLAQRGFNFNADFVQKSIDRLLEKEFLRDYEDGSLGYIA